ncbi:unnamed protein product [Sphenostylis stenocarpa]|uniref:Uncharacterized protein n=1 Tax=Sphenostylis stenocarpa TaxID=92480 RepID=A0AA86S1K3_9FABA|nr:unnamed protein product [Sphenostylis stenocarpa]
MSEVWHLLKKSLHCKSHSPEVHDPQASRSAQRKTHCKNVRDERNKRQSENQVSHEIFLDRSSGEIKICPCYPSSQGDEDGNGVEDPHPSRSTKPTIPSSKTVCVDCDECNVFSKKKWSLEKDSNHPPVLSRHNERETTKSIETAEEHENVPQHSVIQLEREGSACKIIEQICQGNNFTESKAADIECVLRVQSNQERFRWFEECRELVRVKAERVQNEHPRCLVDGNELLRFHGTTVACSLGLNASSSNLCTLDQCGVCQILKHGFSSNQELFHGALGVYTTSTSGKAIHSISSSNIKSVQRKCVMLCRVRAGRIYNPLQEIEEMTNPGFDSLVKKMRDHSEIEELIVLNPRAVLPCFLVIYRL